MSDDYEETTEEFQGAASLAHRLTVKMMLRAHKKGVLMASITGMIAGIVDVLWRLRREGSTPDALKVILGRMVEDFVEQSADDEVLH